MMKPFDEEFGLLLRDIERDLGKSSRKFRLHVLLMYGMALQVEISQRTEYNQPDQWVIRVIPTATTNLLHPEYKQPIQEFVGPDVNIAWELVLGWLKQLHKERNDPCRST